MSSNQEIEIADGGEFRAKGASAGFTFIEVVTAVALLSLLALVLWTGFSTAVAGGVKASRTLKAGTAVLQTERLLRAAAAEVRIPFWETGITARKLDGGIKLPFFKGERDSFLSVRTVSEVLLIETPEGTQRIPLPGEARISLYPEDTLSPEGIELTFSARLVSAAQEKESSPGEVHEVRILAPFAGVGVGGK